MSTWTAARKAWLVERLRSAADKEEATGSKAVADEFRERATLIEQTISGHQDQIGHDDGLTGQNHGVAVIQTNWG
jgi:hypothetical protein